MDRKYTRKAVLEWLHRTIGVDSRPTATEVQTICPKCGSDKFYFNISKLVGICHKAQCHWTPRLDDLIEHVGFAPEETGFYDREDEEEKIVEINLPGQPILFMREGQLYTVHQEALDYLRSRGLTDDVILNWRLTTDGERTYVPIVAGEVLVNYNGRLLPSAISDPESGGGLKYTYASGAKTSHYILGWEECQLWDRLSLVENTFVSLWLRHGLRCSTTFGSNISDVQADLIARARIQSVALLWDEGAEANAQRAIRKLHERGVKAAYWMIQGQPDDYPFEKVERWCGRVFEAADRGVPFVNLKRECHEDGQR